MDVLVEPTRMYARRVTGVTVHKPAAGNELHHYFEAITLLVRDIKRTSTSCVEWNSTTLIFYFDFKVRH
jgi:hypothetical protein